MRLQLKQKASSGGGWFLHSQCVLHSLQKTDTVIGAEGLDGADKCLLTELGVHIAPTSLSVEETPPAAIEVEDENYDVADAASAEQLRPGDDHIMHKTEANELRNMDWWEAADIIGMLKNPVRTMEAPPRDLEAAVEEAKLAVVRRVAARCQDSPGWKLLLMMDRFLFRAPHGPRREQQQKQQ